MSLLVEKRRLSCMCVCVRERGQYCGDFFIYFVNGTIDRFPLWILDSDWVTRNYHKRVLIMWRCVDRIDTKSFPYNLQWRSSIYIYIHHMPDTYLNDRGWNLSNKNKISWNLLLFKPSYYLFIYLFILIIYICDIFFMWNSIIYLFILIIHICDIFLMWNSIIEINISQLCN
jgi:hypothetical protein